VGVVPVDFSRVWLATAASGKGLASYPGLALVFHHEPMRGDQLRLPRYLDLSYYVDSGGIPFTLNSNLVGALGASLFGTAWTSKWQHIQKWGRLLRKRMEALGIPTLAPPAAAHPAVLTLVIPSHYSSRSLGWQFRTAGFLVSYESQYLLERNWLQVCLMGDLDEAAITELAAALPRLWERVAGRLEKSSI
jgi:aspartate aminotransferase-like enzyme